MDAESFNSKKSKLEQLLNEARSLACELSNDENRRSRVAHDLACDEITAASQGHGMTAFANKNILVLSPICDALCSSIESLIQVNRKNLKL